jgi:hypothetical protein
MVIPAPLSTVFLEVPKTRHPARTSLCAVAAPIPAEAPVISTTLFASALVMPFLAFVDTEWTRRFRQRVP